MTTTLASATSPTSATWQPGHPLYRRPNLVDAYVGGDVGAQVVRPIIEVISTAPDEVFASVLATFWCGRCQVGGANSLCWNCGGELG